MKNYRAKIYNAYLEARIDPEVKFDKSDFTSRAPFFLNIIKKHFPSDRTVSIVDLGCGYGSFVYFMRNFGYVNASGVDESSSMIDASRRFNIEKIERANVFSYLKSLSDSSVHVLTAIDLIEHFTKDELCDFAEDANRVLKSGGVLITHQPNAEGVFGGAILYGDFTHENSFTRNSITQIFLASGFASVKNYEDTPTSHSVLGAARMLIWRFIVRPIYQFLLAVETGSINKDRIFTQNFLSVICK